jgi:hypothetical protein
VADFDDAAESGKSFLIDLFVSEKLRVIEEIPQEPAQLPHCLLGAVETTDDRPTGQYPRFDNRESKYIERSGGVPAELRAVDADKVDAVRNFRTRIAGGIGMRRSRQEDFIEPEGDGG